MARFEVYDPGGQLLGVVEADTVQDAADQADARFDPVVEPRPPARSSTPTPKGLILRPSR